MQPVLLSCPRPLLVASRQTQRQAAGDATTYALLLALCFPGAMVLTTV